MLDAVGRDATVARGRDRQGVWIQACVWILFALLALRFTAVWLNAFAGTAVPVPGRVGFTVIFAGFSLAHAASRLGWRRAVAFLLACAVVSWCFEEVGILTGRVYGPYHYSDQLGSKLGDVPLIIPFAWFMMVYASWVVAGLLLEGTSPGRLAMLCRVVVASFAMTSWDTVMDPGMARAGVWTWEAGGGYFGVPLQNYAGWLATTLTVYLVAAFAILRRPAPPALPVSRAYEGLPALVYGLMAVDRLLLPDLTELRVVASFGMGFVAILAAMRLALPSRRFDRAGVLGGRS